MTLNKHFDFSASEDKYSQLWEKSGVFTPAMDAEKDVYSIMMPPPNVTGTLHLGHVLDNTLPDILVRRARMQGKNALYQPGTDHAGIAVHVVLERQWAEEGKTRFDYGREKFLEKAWEWKDYSHGIITSQIRKLGISCDWENERFTMDEGYSEAVIKVFVELYNRGLIYKGQRLVNWDPKMQTAVSDLEVNHKELKGHLWHFKYMYADGFSYDDAKTGQSDGIVIATTRPETILADGAIAINPNDPRVKDLVGKYVIVPIVNRKIPIIADDYVDPEFGSGMVKITAAHDFNDFEVYKHHKDEYDIPLINLLTPEAKMNENTPEDYQGLDRFDAREKIIKDLDSMGLLIKTEEHIHNVGHAERYDIIIEPYLTNQWYVKAGPLAEKCLKVIKNEDITFVNDCDRRVISHWLENIEDWCISRQLWWGHRVPVWYKGEEIYVGEEAPQGEGWTQDTDILDTWFSSALWPFVTQGWPEKTERMKKFYPNTLINSGRDILPFWIMRMLMMGLEFTDEVPFATVYTHGLILDKHGKKMSKSKGNVVNPINLIEKYGVDALRFTMASIASSEDMRFSEQKVEQNRNFCTKMWNAARFMEMNGVLIPIASDMPEVSHPVNMWLLGELKQLFVKIDQHLDKYEFNQAANTLYHFAWGTWCDWYLELTKPLLNGDDKTLADETSKFMGWAYGMMLRALHPLVPFITEELWQQLTNQSDAMMIVEKWPSYIDWKEDEAAQDDINRIINIISSIRTVRAETKVPPKHRLSLGIKGGNDELMVIINKYAMLMNAMAGIENVFSRTEPSGKSDAVAVVEGVEYIMPLEGIIDFAVEKERVEKEIAKMEAEFVKITGLLENASFVERAPEQVVAQNKVKQAELANNISKLKQTV